MMRIRAILAVSVLVAGSSPALYAQAAPAGTHVDLVVRNARLFDGRGAQLREGVSVLIAAGTILAIVDQSAPAALAPFDLGSARSVDAGGRVVARFPGARQWDSVESIRMIERAFSGAGRPTPPAWQA